MKAKTTSRSTYWEKLKSPKWQKKRLEVMERAGFKCETCRSEENTLNVHHIAYKKGADPWDYDLQDLKCLCEDCHAEEHELDKRLEDVINEYKTSWMTKNGYFSKDYLLGLIQAFSWYETPPDIAPVFVYKDISIFSSEQAKGLCHGLKVDQDYSETVYAIAYLNNNILTHDAFKWSMPVTNEWNKNFIRTSAFDYPEELHEHMSSGWTDNWPDGFKEEILTIINERLGVTQTNAVTIQ